LASIGLSKYESLFVKEEITLSLLLELNEPQLEKLGLPFGPRQLVLKAISSSQGSTLIPIILCFDIDLT